jgi:hypothetical protein
MSKLAKQSVEIVDLAEDMLDHVNGAAFLRGSLYKSMQTGGVEGASSFGTNNTEAVTVSAPICDDTLISQTYFCPKVTT